MQHLIDSIRMAVNTKNWYAALSMTLALPDICCALELGKTTENKYAAWFDKYLGAQYIFRIGAYFPEGDPNIEEMKDRIGRSDTALIAAIDAGLKIGRTETVFLTGKDVYALRCAYLHEGKNRYDLKKSSLY